MVSRCPSPFLVCSLRERIRLARGTKIASRSLARIRPGRRPSTRSRAIALRDHRGQLAVRLLDGVVNRDQLRAIGESRLDLNLVDHLRDTFHYLVATENFCTEAHDLRNGFAVTGRLHHLGGEDRYG